MKWFFSYIFCCAMFLWNSHTYAAPHISKFTPTAEQLSAMEKNLAMYGEQTGTQSTHFSYPTITVGSPYTTEGDVATFIRWNDGKLYWGLDVWRRAGPPVIEYDWAVVRWVFSEDGIVYVAHLNYRGRSRFPAIPEKIAVAESHYLWPLAMETSRRTWEILCHTYTCH